MTLAPLDLSEFDAPPAAIRDRLPAASYQFAPTDLDEAAAMLAAASDAGASVMFVGGGTHQDIGHPVDADVVMSSLALDGIETWEPDDLTVVVQPGVRVQELEATLAQSSQTAGLAEWGGPGTVGGAIAAGISGYRRARIGPTRDRVLEVEIVTGDGRRVVGGGRVVKNVSGYDLPRLATGSLGTLGLVGSICLKLWPTPERSATMPVDDPAVAWSRLHRPLAVLETDEGSAAYVQGTPAEVEHHAGLLGVTPSEGLRWPAPPVGVYGWSVRVPPASTKAAVERLGGGLRFVAQHGVGVVDAAGDDLDAGRWSDLRGWAESLGGSVVLTRYPEPSPPISPFGAPPAALDLQRRVIATFDPAGICNPGRLMGSVR